MNRVLVIALVLAMAAPASGVLAAGAGQTQGVGSISGVAHAGSKVAANTTVRLRGLANGQLAETATTNTLGQFTFTGLNPGNYVIEVVNAAGDIIGTSATVSVAAGAAVTGVAVTLAATAATVAGGSFFTSTLGIVSVAAAGAAVAGVTVAANRPTASGSK
jgi:hypothetical protein